MRFSSVACASWNSSGSLRHPTAERRARRRASAPATQKDRRKLQHARDSRVSPGREKGERRRSGGPMRPEVVPPCSRRPRDQPASRAAVFCGFCGARQRPAHSAFRRWSGAPRIGHASASEALVPEELRLRWEARVRERVHRSQHEAVSLVEPTRRRVDVLRFDLEPPSVARLSPCLRCPQQRPADSATAHDGATRMSQSSATSARPPSMSTSGARKTRTAPPTRSPFIRAPKNVQNVRSNCRCPPQRPAVYRIVVLHPRHRHRP